jgi:hypothetical protein
MWQMRAVPTKWANESMLTIQLVNRISERMRGITGGALNCTNDLIGHSLVGQLIVTQGASNTLFQLAGEVSARARNALARAPERRVSGEVLYIIVAGRVLRSGLVEHHVGYDANTDTRENPGKSFHGLILLPYWMQMGNS